MSDQGNSTDSSEQQQASGRSVAEWTTLISSVLIILALISVIAFLHLRGSTEPPRIVARAQMQQIRHEDSGYYVPVDVINEGDSTVENVTVQAELDTGSGQPRTAEFSIAFLAGGEHVHGTFVFANDPASGELKIQAVSYTQP